MLQTLIRPTITERLQPTLQQSLIIAYVVGVLWTTTVWWMDHVPSMAPSEINAHFERLTLPGVDAMLCLASARWRYGPYHRACPV